MISLVADNQILDSYEKENVKISHEALFFMILLSGIHFKAA